MFSWSLYKNSYRDLIFVKEDFLLFYFFNKIIIYFFLNTCEKEELDESDALLIDSSS